MFRLLIRHILFKLDPEMSHTVAIMGIKFLHRLPFIPKWLHQRYFVTDSRLERTVFGIKFAHPIGLAAGFDKDAKVYKEMANLGFSFIEIGTVTPIAQAGNSKKRLFRLIKDNAIINRMGFNNEGVDIAKIRLLKNDDIIIGGNIGKNKNTTNEDAVKDYLYSFESLFDVVDYFVVNVSSPNTPNLRDLQEKEPLTHLLNTLQEANQKHKKSKPILLKIAPDLSDNQLIDIIDIVTDTKIAGVIATNTTINRSGLLSSDRKEVGGLSGQPLRARSTEVIRFLSEKSQGAFPIIGVGGIHSEKDALEKLEAGASLIQLYTGFVYEGPRLITKINQKLLDKIDY